MRTFAQRSSLSLCALSGLRTKVAVASSAPPHQFHSSSILLLLASAATTTTTRVAAARDRGSGNIMALPGGAGARAEAGNYYGAVVSRNGVILPWSRIRRRSRGGANDDDRGVDGDDRTGGGGAMDASDLLRLLPRGAYTTCRTVKGGTRVYQFDYHVRRLADSAASILESVSASAEDDWGGGGNESTPATATRRGGARGATMAETDRPARHCGTPSAGEARALDVTNEAWVRDTALACIRGAVDEFRKRYPFCTHDAPEGGDEQQQRRELRIVLLATWERREGATGEATASNNASEPSSRLGRRKSSLESALYCHVSVLPQSQSTTSGRRRRTRVLVRGRGRDNALAKDSRWVVDREGRMPVATATAAGGDGSNDDDGEEDGGPRYYEDVVLLDDDGGLLEGTRTNFYVVVDGGDDGGSGGGGRPAVVTADEGVLKGSVRDSVLRVCEAHRDDVDVVLRPPTLRDLRAGGGAFVTSTSRLVMPVHEVVLGDSIAALDGGGGGDGDKNAEDIVYRYDDCVTTRRIQGWVLEDVEKRSTSVY